VCFFLGALCVSFAPFAVHFHSEDYRKDAKKDPLEFLSASPLETILRTINLGKQFSTRWAVRDLNLEVHKGDVFGFLGPNGAGKSTTIRMLLSLIRPTTGDIELFGKSLRENRRACLSRVGGLVESADFYLYLSARRNLEIVGAMLGGVASTSIDRVLELVDLSDRALDKVKTFSHGMKQRLGIAQTLLGSPECIILDEPTTGLDPQGIKDVRELIRRLASEKGLTVFLSSHLLGEIEQTATSMAIINEGTLVVQGKVQELLSESVGSVRIEAHPIDRARDLLQREPVVKAISTNDRFLDLEVPGAEAPRLNALLVHAGIEVRAVIPRRSLEEYFLALTEQAQKSESSTVGRIGGHGSRRH